MIIEGTLRIFLVGCMGGFCVELIHWWHIKREPEWPIYFKSLIYWVITLLMIAAGGVVCWLYFGESGDGIKIFHVGITTPLLLQKLSTTIPEVGGARGASLRPGPKATIRSFFKW